MSKLASIISFSTRFKSYGHWLITLEIENPNLLLSDDDYYLKFNDKEDEEEILELYCTTTDSRAIDGEDGFEVTLAHECLRKNDINTNLVDFSSLKSE
jgi:hypothetical protein